MSKRYNRKPDMMLEIPPDAPILTIANWSPGAEGEGVACTQVHLLIDIPEVVTFVIRFKSRAGLDRFIADLVSHRDDVWPTSDEAQV